MTLFFYIKLLYAVEIAVLLLVVPIKCRNVDIVLA